MALPSAAEDAARIEQLRAELLRPLPDPLPYAPTGTGPGTAQRVSLGEAYRHRMIRLIPGTRLPELPAGSTRIWTTDAVAAQTPASVDLLRLAQVHPDLRLTEPADVVFTSHGKPAAVVDNDGGAAVPYPARILRARSTRLAPAGIADAINRVPQGNRKWRTWLVPLVQIDPAYANDMLGALDVWESALRQRKTQLDELRQLVIRSVLTGAVTLATAPPPGDAAGPPPRAPG